MASNIDTKTGGGIIPFYSNDNLSFADSILNFTQTEFVEDLKKLQSTLSKEIYSWTSDLFDLNNYHSINVNDRKTVLKRLEDETNILQTAILGYLDLEIIDISKTSTVGPIQNIQVLPFKNVYLEADFTTRNYPYFLFSNYADSSYYGPIIGEFVDDIELNYLPEFPDSTFYHSSSFEIAKKEFMMWFRTLRLCIASVIVRSFPYQEIWGPGPNPKSWTYLETSSGKIRGGIYGTGGYLLAQKQLPELIKTIMNHPTYSYVNDNISQYDRISKYVSFSNSTAKVNLEYDLQSFISETYIWMNNYNSQIPNDPNVISSEGVAFPFKFVPLTPEIPCSDNNGDNIYARDETKTRIGLIKKLWENVVQKLNIVKDPHPSKNAGYKKESSTPLPFICTAGSLQFGGRHPPHLTHMNGLFLDATVNLPKLIPINANSKAERDYESPDGGRKTKDSKKISYEKLNIAFIQCCLTYFPSLVIFASWDIFHQAVTELLDGLQNLQDQQLYNNFSNYYGTSGNVKLIRNNGKDNWGSYIKGSGGFQFLQLASHNDHWHIQFDPIDLILMQNTIVQTCLNLLEKKEFNKQIQDIIVNSAT